MYSNNSLFVYAVLCYCYVVTAGVPAGGLRLVRPDGMPQFPKAGDGLEKVPSSFSPNSRPVPIRPPPCPGQVLPIQNQGMIQIPVEGRGTADLQMFVSRVRPSQQFLAQGEMGCPTVPQHFSPGSQKQPMYATAEQPLSQFGMLSDVMIKTDPHTELSEQTTAVCDATGMLVVSLCYCYLLKLFVRFSLYSVVAHALIQWSHKMTSNQFD